MLKNNYIKLISIAIILLLNIIFINNVYATEEVTDYISVQSVSDIYDIKQGEFTVHGSVMTALSYYQAIGSPKNMNTNARIWVWNLKLSNQEVYCMDAGLRMSEGTKIYSCTEYEGRNEQYIAYIMSNDFEQRVRNFDLEDATSDTNSFDYNMMYVLKQILIWNKLKGENTTFAREVTYHLIGRYVDWGASEVAELVKYIDQGFDSGTDYGSLYVYSSGKNGYQRLITNKYIEITIITSKDDEDKKDPGETPDDDPDIDDRTLYSRLTQVLFWPRFTLNDDPNSAPQTENDGINETDNSVPVNYHIKETPLGEIDPETGLPKVDKEQIWDDTTISIQVPENYGSDNHTKYLSSVSISDVDGANQHSGYDMPTYSYTSTYSGFLHIVAYYESRYILQKYYCGGSSGREYNELSGIWISEKYRANYSGTYLAMNKSDGSSISGFIHPWFPYSYNVNDEIYAYDIYSGEYINANYNYGNSKTYARQWSPKSGDIYNFDASAEIEVGNGKSYAFGNYFPSHAEALKVENKYDYEAPVGIYVRHWVNNNGNYELDYDLSNDNEIVTISQWGGGKYEAPNGYDERKTVYTDDGNLYVGDYFPDNVCEYYRIDENDKIIVSRSSTILKDGYYYKCTEVRRDGNRLDNLVVEADGNAGDDIYIDYYYEKVPYSVVDDPSDDGGRNQLPGNKDNGIEISKLKFTAVSSESGSYDSYLNSSNFSQSGNISYVPAKENLRAYLEASIVKAKNLKYHIGVNGYDVETYTAYGIDNTYEVGSVNGFTGGARENIYNTGTSTPIYSAKQSEIENTVYKTKDEVMDKDTGGVFNGSPSSTDSNITGKLNTITSKYVTDKEYFKTDKAQYVESNKYNGLRNPNGAIYYKEYNVMNHEKYGTSYTKKVSDADTMDVDIYTPFEVGNITIKSSNDVVDHSKETTENGLAVIQQNADFTLTVRSNEDGACYQDLYTRVGGSGYNPLYKYLQYYYVKLDFDVKITSGSYRVWSVNGSSENATVGIARNANPGDVVEKGSIIRLVPNSGVGVLYANAYSTSENTSKVNYNKYKAYASTVNVVSEDYTVDQIAKSSYTASDTGTGTPYIDNKQIALHSDDRSYQNISGLKRDAFYIVSSLKKTISLGRIFDFEITDCTDVNFKNVFRKSTNADGSYTVNDLTGIAYYSGFNRLRLRDEWAGYNINYYTNRDNNSAITYGYVKTVVPLGPYKNTSNEYISAPKLGYRFSFDIKTSGYFDPLDKDKYSTDRKVEISPSYYYISKDGAQVKNNIKLYYKNASGKYVAFENSGYTISYKPNDGYRTLLTDDTTPVKDNYLTTNLKTLDISKTFTLTGKDMITMSDHGFIQSWYGEFKLPNSTIAVEVDDSGSVIDINNPLKDGYIAVKFDMRCIDTYTDTNGSKQTVTIEYNRKNANDSRENTTQWDYEGYLGFDVNKQNLQDLKLQLEKGTYTVGTQDRYNQIKGTVAFFDIDSRAADDFE